MVRLIAPVVILGLLSGCGPKMMSPTDIETEKKAIESMVSTMWKAYESKDLAGTTALYTTSGDLEFFGTDSAEIVRTIPQWESQVKNDWELFQNAKFGDLKNVSVILSNDGELGSIICEMPADMTVGGQQMHSLFRLASALRKENGQWRFVHGMAAVATVGQSSAELIAKTKAGAVKE